MVKTGKNTKNNACKNSLPCIIAVDAQKLERKVNNRIDTQCLVNWYFCTKRDAKNLVILHSSDNSSSLFFALYHTLYGTPKMLLHSKYQKIPKNNQNQIEVKEVKSIYSKITNSIRL
jgi:hypothetical protein